MSRFVDKTVIVTGGASGIGRAAVGVFLREGAKKVVAVDVNAEALATLDKPEDGERLSLVVGDIALPSTIEEAIAAAGGCVDVLANIAGIMDGFVPVGEVDDAAWDRVFTVNVTATMRFMRAVLPTMQARGNGAIVNVASVAGYKGGAAGAAYTASKHAVIGLTRHAAVIYGPMGIRINGIAPGGTATGMTMDWQSELAHERLGPLFAAHVGAMAPAATLAGQIAWLASAEAENVNGTILVSDGGWSAS